MYKIVLNWHKIKKARALGRKCPCTKGATGQPLRFFATQFFWNLWSVVHRRVVLATVKGIWGVTHFQEENSWFIPVLLSLPLNWNRVPAIFFHTPYKARHSRMIGKAWPANFNKATMKLATKTRNLFCASYHPRIKSILQQVRFFQVA